MTESLSRPHRREILERGGSDPVWFFREILGAEPWPTQAQVIEAVRDHRHVAVRSSHSVGKTWLAGRLALWWLYTHVPSIVITTAPTDRQVKHLLWSEIRTAHSTASLPLGGSPLLQELKLADDHFALGFTAPERESDRFQGFHSPSILVIADEASGISPEIHDAIDGVLASGTAHKLEIGNPIDGQSRFSDSFKGGGARTFQIPAFATPNFTTFGIKPQDIASGAWEEMIGNAPLPAPHLVTPEWVSERYARWGVESPMYQSRVLAEFPQEGTDALIPLAWIEAATRRTLRPAPGDPNEIGVDVARSGPDETVIGQRQGPCFTILRTMNGQRTMETTGRVREARGSTGATRIKVDVVGVGAGVVDRLQEVGEPVIGVNFGAGANDSERFANARAEAYWGLRTRFEEGQIDIPEDDLLVEQLANLKWAPDSAGRVLLAKKQSPSPDRADCLAIAFSASGREPGDLGVTI